MLGRFVSDLAVGDVLGPVEYVITPFIAREYAHAVEETDERFHRDPSPAAPQLVPPTLVHIEKIRLFDHACPEGDGPVPRIHYEYDADYHHPIVVGTRVRVRGEVVARQERNGRERLVTVIEVRDAATGELYTTSRDMAIITYNPKAGA